MTPQFSTTTLASFHLWVDNWIAQKGAAYTNHSSRLFYQADPRLPQYVSYAAPFRSWVCDSGVPGAHIPVAISGSFGTIQRGQSGMVIDFENGRVLLPAAIGRTAIVSGSYAFKDINVYKANENQEQMVFGNKYYLNPRFAVNVATGAPPIEWDDKLKAYNMVTPCIFVNESHVSNKPWALGGQYNTSMTVTVSILAETQNQLEGVLSLFNDAKDICFPSLPLSAWPLNFLGDWKGGTGYNYETLKTEYGTPSNVYSITDVSTSKLSDSADIDPSVFLGVADFTVAKVRRIH